jgi:hypothetical protein
MDRRPGTYSQFGQSPYSGHIPLPHEDQAHFYAGGLPDLDSVVPLPQTGLSPGERGYYVGFDSLSTSGHGPSVSSENVMLIGEEGALRVYRVSRKAVDIIGRLEGLHGAVIGAKVLPWTFRSDSALSGRPYIALVLHGPVLPPEDEAAASSDTSATPSMEDNDTSPEPSTTRAEPSTTRATFRPSAVESRDYVRQYQTTVEIYSLSTRQHVATIFKCPPVDIEYTHAGEMKLPPPSGDLRIDAKGKFLAVASGTSGEVFIFSYFPRGPKIDDLQSIRCIGKLWTSVQRRETKPSTGAANGVEVPAPPEEQDSRRVALFSLSHRWIAVVPPSADSLFTMKGIASLASQEARPLGIRSHGPPPKPTTTCGLDTPENESLMDRVSRELTQQVLKGAQWATEQGMQAWNNYWYRSQQANQSNGNLYAPDVSGPAFPPTHGVSQSPPSAASPTQVSIFDMQRLLDAEEMKVKNALVPIATFEPPSGCSHLSFAPSGLVLLTVSRKGDQQFVWSLMRMQHPCIGLTYENTTPPYVRQMAKFTRMTVASVVDVVWNTPQGNRFAILTERGTIHVHEIPATAFQWPPLRRARRQKQPPKPENKDDDPSGAKGPVSTAMDTINGTGAWLRSVSIRPRSIGNATTFPAALMMTPAATANVGGKVVKAGFNKGVRMVSNSANTIYHASENKLHIGNLSNGILPGCMHWMSGRDHGYFAIVVTGTLSIYAVRQTSTSQKGKPPLVRARISKKPVEFALHRISDSQFPPAFKAAMQMRYQGISKPYPFDVGGVWHLRAPTSTIGNAHANSAAKRGKKPESWHAMFETESNPPCQPFHTDRRVTICAYPEPEGKAPSAPPQHTAEPEEFDAYEEDLASWQDEILDPWLQNTHHILPRSHNQDPSPPIPWVFGEDIVADKILSGGNGVVSGDSFTDGDEVENKIHVIDGLDGEQVHVTMVRRVGREEEDFFEDGCEVVEFADERT